MNTYGRPIRPIRLFKKLRNKAKQTYYESLLKDCQNFMKRTWQMMKEIIRKSKLISNWFSKSINFNGNAIKKNSHIPEELDKYFTNVGANVDSKIQKAFKTFEDFQFPVGRNIEYRDLAFEEFEKAFK